MADPVLDPNFVSGSTQQMGEELEVVPYRVNGEWRKALCVPVQGATGCVTENAKGETYAIYALTMGDSGLYARYDAVACRELESAFRAMAERLESDDPFPDGEKVKFR